MRTSSAANVGVDKDSEKRQRAAIETFAKRAGLEIAAWFYDPAVSGADPIEARPGFSGLLDRLESNGIRTVVVEDASRFARGLVAQELGVLLLIKRSVRVLTANGDDLTSSSTEGGAEMTTRGTLIRGACAVTALIAGSLVETCWAGDVTIKDGDTILIDGKTCRLDAIDAPELDQVCLDEHGGGVPCGREARERLAQFIGGRAVHCEDNGPDPAFRKRRICTCTVEGETMSINRWLVHEGLAINFEPFARGRFQSDEDDARQNRRGWWRGCFAAAQHLRYWRKLVAPLLGSTCANEPNARDKLFPENPEMPPGCSIKGRFAVRAKVTGYRGIYHLEGCRSYRTLKNPNRWFCSEEDAQAAGFRRALTCRGPRAG